VIPVLWLSLHEDAPARGNWDQAMLEALFSNDLYPVPGFEFVSSECGVEWPVDGVVVVVSGFSHAEDVERINELIGRLGWVLLVVTSDEEGLFPVNELRHPNMKLWLQYPHPERTYPTNATFIPCGWPPGTKEVLWAFRERDERHHDWFFAGQVTHERREECVAHLRDIPNGYLVETDGFAKGLPRGTYLSYMRDSKVVPCPSGPHTPDTFRLYEALEAGCVPIVDTWPGGGFQPPTGLPAPFVTHTWGVAPAMVEEICTRYPSSSIECFEWWQATKRRWAHVLASDLTELGAIPNESNGRDDEITVLISCSPIPSHPSTEILDETIASVRRQLPRAEIIIMLDGVRAEQEDRRADYELFIQRVQTKCNFDWTNVIPFASHSHLHQGLMTRLVLDMVNTPTILFVEHDTPIEGDIPWNDVVDVVSSGMLNVVRFMFFDELPVEWDYLMLDPGPVEVAGLPVRRTAQWSQRPHLANVRFYDWMLDRFIGTRSRTFIEDAVYGPCEGGLDSRAAWGDWRVAIYHPEGSIKRSSHLDGRGGDVKWDPKFAYDGEVPHRAPQPTEGS
jgi:hypothetical protein